MRVLIVDDEEIIRQGVRILLEECHPAVNIIGEASHGRDALEMIEQLAPDLLIADIQMPVMDGLELIRQASLRYPDMVKVILTGHAAFEYAQTALQYGVTDYLLKPVTRVKINELIQDVLTKNPARWLDGLDVSMLREMKELANSLVKEVLAEEQEAVEKRLTAWQSFCDSKLTSMHELKQIMGVVKLSFQTEMLIRHSDPVRVDESVMQASSAQELFGRWRSELLRVIEEVAQKRVPRNKRIVNYVLSLIDQEYGNPELTISDLAERAGVSASYLSKMFREHKNQPFTYYLSEYRLEKVKAKLDSDEETLLSYIAEKCGFSDYPYFSKVFKKHFGMSPQDYREKNSRI